MTGRGTSNIIIMMAKRKKKRKRREAGRQPEKKVEERPKEERLDAEAISSRGKKTIGAGVALLIIGFVVLSFTDPEGRNWASTLSPFLILGAYAVIAAGIFLPDEAPQEKTPEAAPVPDSETHETSPQSPS